MNWLRRVSPSWKIFLTCWVIYALHFAMGMVREHHPAFALAERGTLRVDLHLGLHEELFQVEGSPFPG
jgi:hypothetical protein